MNEQNFRTTDTAPERKPYTLKEGFTHVVAGEGPKAPGDTVYLTDQQYAAFSDRFVPQGAPTAAPVAAPAGPAPQGTSGIAQDVNAKTPRGERPADTVDEPGPATSKEDREHKRGR